MGWKRDMVNVYNFSDDSSVHLYHATSFESMISILNNGFNSKLASIVTWNCSNVESTYFRPQRTKIDYVSHNFDEPSIINILCHEQFKGMLYSGRINAAVQKSESNLIAIIEVVAPLSFIQEDISMNPYGENDAVTIPSWLITKDMINRIILVDGYDYQLGIITRSSLNFHKYANDDYQTEFDYCWDNLDLSNRFAINYELLQLHPKFSRLTFDFSDYVTVINLGSSTDKATYSIIDTSNLDL